MVVTYITYNYTHFDHKHNVSYSDNMEDICCHQIQHYARAHTNPNIVFIDHVYKCTPIRQ